MYSHVRTYMLHILSAVALTLPSKKKISDPDSEKKNISTYVNLTSRKSFYLQTHHACSHLFGNLDEKSGNNSQRFLVCTGIWENCWENLEGGWGKENSPSREGYTTPFPPFPAPLKLNSVPDK